MRAIVAMLCTVLLMSSAAPAGITAVAVLLIYDLWAGLVLWSEASGKPLAWPLLQYWIDISWTGLVLQLTGSSANMLILTMVQPVVLASISYTVGHGLALAVYAALWMLIQIDPRHDIDVSLIPGRIAQALAVLALVPAAAVLARPMSVLRHRLGLVRELEARLDPRHGVGVVTTALVEGLRRDLSADLSGIVLPAGGEGVALLCTADEAAFQASPPVHARLELLLAAMPAYPVTHTAPQRWRWRRGTRLHAAAGAVAEPALRKALDELCALLEMRCLVIVPLRRYDQRHGHLLVGRHGPQVQDQEVAALADAAPELFRIIEQAALVDQLVRETTANERMRIGRDLHDSAIQPYLGLKYALEAVVRRVGRDNPARIEIESLARLVEGEITTLRDIVTGLRNGQPAGDDALLPAVRRQVRHFGQLFNIEVKLDCPDPLTTSRALAGAVFHMVNEALNNVRKHTPARSVQIGLAQRDGWLRLSVQDNAGSVRGHPAPDFSPRSLIERTQALGGSLAVVHPDGLNTEIVISVPLDAIVKL